MCGDMTKDVYDVTLFNEFTITYGEETINVSKYLGKQLVNLFQIFLHYNGQSVHKDTLIEILWPESENPNSVLKFTIHRFRKDVQKIPFFKGKELILTVKQGYQLNPDFEWHIDSEKFSKLWEKIKFEDHLDSQTMKIAYRMVDLYKGKFYVSNSQLMWALQICEFYRQAYVKCVLKICKKLLDEQKFEEMMALNYQAILLEPFYEGLHYYYMKGLLETSDYHKALRYYDDLNESFIKELGTGLSLRFKELYDAIIDDHDNIAHIKIDHLLKQLSQRTEQEGGFYCTFDMFKYMYELLLKNALRDNKKLFLISFEISHDENSEEEIIKAVNKVKRVIALSLRKNDLFAKVSQGQFVVLVDCKNVDNAYLIIQRISQRFYKKFRNKKLRLNYYITEAKLLNQDELA